MAGPYPYPEPYPQQYPPTGAPGYPGMLPPPVPYRRRRRGGLLLGLLALLVVAAVVVATIVLNRDQDAGPTAGPLSDAAARTAIQGYLDALSNGNDETIARNTLCGLFDKTKDKRSDMALAGLASDAFRKQFSRAEVSSIDTIVPWSEHQLQVLFTMRVTPAGRGQQAQATDEQAVAQLLVQGRDVLVCSYLLRSGGSY